MRTNRMSSVIFPSANADHQEGGPPQLLETVAKGGELMPEFEDATLLDMCEALADELKGTDGTRPNKILLRTPGHGEWSIQGFRPREQHPESRIVGPRDSEPVQPG
jgi:hypothetical protein